MKYSTYGSIEMTFVSVTGPMTATPDGRCSRRPRLPRPRADQHVGIIFSAGGSGSSRTTSS